MIMRKSLIVVGIILMSYFSLQAKKIDGTIILENDTLIVTLKIPYKFLAQEPNYEKLQYKIKYFDTEGNKVILKPHEAKEIRFNDGFDDIRMLSRPNNLDLGSLFSISSHIFLKLEIDGNLKLFKYHYTQSSGGMYNGATGTYTAGYSYNVEKYILQKGDEELKRTRSLVFRKDLMDYFSDCPELAKKIEEKEFRKRDLELIVQYYNSHCGNK